MGLVPNRFIAISVAVICLGLLGSAIFNFATLLRMHTLYLANRGNAITLSVESRARGGGRRSNPEFWQPLLEEKYAAYAEDVAFLALVDRNGSILASAGKPPFGPVGLREPGDGDVYVFEEALGRSRNARGEDASLVAGRSIRVGLYTSDADFIRRQAWILLAVSGAAIAALIVVSLCLMRMFSRFLELKMRESSEANLRSLGVMAASLAHEIRNPLGSMKGLTQLVQEGLPPDDRAQGHLRTVVGEAERLERLVSDLLDFARPKERQIGAFSLSGLLSDVRAMMEPRFAAAGVALQWGIDPGLETVRSDAGGIRQVLLNLLVNALEATPEGGTVDLRIAADGEDRSWTVRIDDTGRGLQGRDAEELFEPFVTTGPRGTGLGLTISRTIIEGLGGTLTLEERPEGGMRCTVRLPRA